MKAASIQSVPASTSCTFACKPQNNQHPSVTQQGREVRLPHSAMNARSFTQLMHYRYIYKYIYISRGSPIGNVVNVPPVAFEVMPFRPVRAGDTPKVQTTGARLGLYIISHAGQVNNLRLQPTQGRTGGASVQDPSNTPSHRRPWKLRSPLLKCRLQALLPKWR